MVNERAVANITALVARPEIGGNEKFLIAVTILKELGIGFELFGKLDPQNAHSFTHEINRLKEAMNAASDGGVVLLDEWAEHVLPSLSEDSWDYAFQGLRNYVPQQTTPPEEVLNTLPLNDVPSYPETADIQIGINTTITNHIFSTASIPTGRSRPAWLSGESDDTIGRG